MNPFRWSKEHQVALILALVVGAVVGVVVGYLAYASSTGADGAVSIYYWVKYRSPSYLWWGIGGAAVGGALIYIKRLNSD